jgi:hypothetical protein
MTQEPRHEVEVQGRAGEPVSLPVGNGGETAYAWTLELPDGVEAAEAEEGLLRIRAERAGSYVLLATLAEPGAASPMTVLPIRLTVV